MSKRVVIACGSGIATSTLAVHKFQNFCDENGIDVQITQCSYGETDAMLTGADLLLTTQKYDQEFPVPTEVCFAYITGIGEEELNQRLLKILKDRYEGSRMHFSVHLFFESRVSDGGM